MKKLICCLLAFMLICASAFAATHISVSGTGQVYVPADQAALTLGICIRDEEVLQAQSRANEVIAAIRGALAAHGVPAENVSTAQLSLYPVYDYSSEISRITAYEASSSLTIVTADMDDVGALIDLAFGAGANSMSNVSFTAENTAQARDEALSAAVADAMQKARIIAGAAGLNITGIEEIRDSRSSTYAADNYYAEAAAGRMDKTVVQAASICVSAELTLTVSAEEGGGEQGT